MTEHLIVQRELQKKHINIILTIVLICIVPLIFKTNSGFKFYHTIYCDYAIGVMIYFCLMLVFREMDIFSITVSLIGLSLSKMTSIIYVPLIILFYILINYFANKKSLKTILLNSLFSIVVVFVFWLVFVTFANRYIDNSLNIQR